MSLSSEALGQIGGLFDQKVNQIVNKLEGRIQKNEEQTTLAHKRLDGHEQPSANGQRPTADPTISVLIRADL